GASQLTERATHGFVEPRRIAQMALDQVRDDFGIRLGGEPMTVGCQPLSQRYVVFDDAVVNDDEAARAVGVRMRVLVRGAAMGRPAGVAYADEPLYRTVTQQAFEDLDPARGPPDLEPFRADHRDTGRVVAPVLEALETVQDDVDGALLADVADDATHIGTRR